MRTVVVSLLLTWLLAGGELYAQQQVVSQQYVVASGHPEATKVGLKVLRDGGNVIDAAVATSLALGVAEPYGSGLGGKLIMLYRDASTGRVYSIVALCTSPKNMDAKTFAELSSSERKYGYKAVGVPGLPAGIWAAHQRWGSKPWGELVEPAAQLAEEGIVLNDVMHQLFKPHLDELKDDPEAAKFYLIDGAIPDSGSRIKNPDLAKTLRLLGAEGIEPFYRGEIAQRVVAAAQQAGSALSREDFSQYRPDISPPLSAGYHGYRIYSAPPPLTGGVTVLAALKCLEGLKEEAEVHDILRLADPLGRALLVLYPLISDTIADVPTARVDAVKMLSDRSTRDFRQRAEVIDPNDPYSEQAEEPSESDSEALPVASTSHLVVVDRQGNMVSLTQSLSLHFGAAVIAPGTGFLLNDSMSNFSTRTPDAVNHVGAGKRARSTVAPVIVTDEGRPFLALGIPGGQRIPTTTAQLLWRVLHRNQSLADAFEASRFHVRRPVGANQPPNLIDLEGNSDKELDTQLEALGWQVVRRKRDGLYFGGGNAAQYDAQQLIGVADSRRTNAVAGE